MVRHPNGLRFEVLEADPRRIKRVRIHPRHRPRPRRKTGRERADRCGTAGRAAETLPVAARMALALPLGAIAALALPPVGAVPALFGFAALMLLLRRPRLAVAGLPDRLGVRLRLVRGRLLLDRHRLLSPTPSGSGLSPSRPWHSWRRGLPCYRRLGRSRRRPRRWRSARRRRWPSPPPGSWRRWRASCPGAFPWNPLALAWAGSALDVAERRLYRSYGLGLHHRGRRGAAGGDRSPVAASAAGVLPSWRCWFSSACSAAAGSG